MYKGKLISLEGGDGSGKGSQIRLLNDYLTLKGFDVLCSREPGGVSIPEQIRKIILSPENKEMKPLTELLLYESARAQIVEELILPNLKAGKIVLLDRFYDSSTAYQGYGRGLGPELADKLNMIATGGLKPDITFFLDLPAELGLSRCIKEEFGSKGDRLEQEKIEFHERLRQGYLEIAKKEPGRMKVIDVEKNGIEEAHEIIKKYVNMVLNI